MDLSILGWVFPIPKSKIFLIWYGGSVEAEQYDEYSKNIRLEYIHYPDEAFKPGRTKVLQSFVASLTPLFRTKEFQQKWIIT